MNLVIKEMTSPLPTFTVLKSDGDGWMKYASDDTIVNNVGGEGVFDLYSKIEIEPAKTGSGYFHLRFYQNNKYLARGADKWLVANSTTPEEDTSKPSCTLFSLPDQTGTLQHVQSLGNVIMMQDSTKRFYVDPSYYHLFTFLDWDTFVKLPKRVAFKGDNGCYLQGVLGVDDCQYLQFVESDMNQEKCGYEIFNLPDGHIAVKSDLFGNFWRRNGDYSWILADSTSYGSYDNNTLFWPVKIDETTIALRNEGNKNFCKRYTEDGCLEDLNAGTPTITNDTITGVVERVRSRTVYNVIYRMDEARIHNLQPFLAGTTTAINNSDEEAMITVSLTYEDSRSYSFSQSVSITAGVKATFKAGVLGIVEGGLEVSFSVDYTIQWGDTTTTTKSITASGAVRVPAKSSATVSYVGTMGTCDVPFSYIQEDVSTVDGSIVRTDEIDGMFRGVNSYNFNFQFDKVEAL